MAEPGQGRLCQDCKDVITELDVALIQMTKRTMIPSSWKHSVAGACYICIRLWKHIINILGDPDTEVTFQFHRDSLNTPKGNFSLGVDFWYFKTKRGYRNHSLPYFVVLPESVLSDAKVPKYLPSNTGSTESLRQAKRWIQDCCQNHQECRRTTTSLPTRLIHVEQGATQLSARLCNSTSLSPGTPYLTLSHLWGSIPFLTLTQSNISSFRHSLPVSDLSKTFQDALKATATLGFDYIWIDSLCIIQDSDNMEDWKNESERMGDVYKNATCNLAACAFEENRYGMFAERQASEVLPPEVTLGWIDGDEAGSRFSISEQDPFMHVFDKPLFKRGWVAQEQFLALRTLFFGADVISWSCNYLDCVNEIWPQGWPYGVVYETTWRGWRKRQGDFPKMMTLEKVSFLESPYADWRELMSEYSGRQLSFPSDRLPAIQGFAREFATALKDENIFGIWKNDLFSSLHWQQSRPTSNPSGEPDWSCAPSWSWASLDLPLNWDILESYPGAEWFARTLIVSVGEPSYHLLQLRGPLIQLDLEKIKRSTFTRPIDFIDREATSFFTLCNTEPPRDFLFKIDQWYFSVHSSVASATQSSILKDAFILWLSTWQVGRHIKKAAGLVLVLVPSIDPCGFRRIGFVESRASLNWEPRHDSKLEVLQLLGSYAEGSDEEGKCTVTIC